MMIPSPDPNDPLKVRRILTFLCFFQFSAFVPIILYVVVAYGVSESIALALIGLEGAVLSGPAGAYLVAAHKKDST